MRRGTDLGPFRVMEWHRSGGMATVWRGEHRRLEIPVAIKVMNRSAEDDARYRSAFELEVRAMAGLEHPGVAQVLDCGEDEGNPYLVMEWAGGGTLARWLTEPRPWPDVRQILLGILDALSHAHARGLVHRDLKPSNVLFCSAADLRPGLKIGDFGIAYSSADQSGAVQTAGTASYMPLEQLLGQWRNYGPWTDLFALGCIGWRLATGDKPYAAGPLMPELRPFRPRISVPEGLEAWLTRLLDHDAGARWPSCAHAAAALVELGGPVVDADDSASIWSLVWCPTLTSLHEPPTELVDHPTSAQSDGSRAPSDGVVLPDDWRSAVTPPPSLPLRGAGEALVGLQAIPMVGREAEQDRLWAALLRTHRTRRTGVVVIRGAAGTGKSRLAEWLVTRAHELGIHHSFHATHESTPDSADGLGPMLARALRTVGLDGPARRKRVGAIRPDCPDDELRAFCDFIAEDTETTGAVDRQILVARHLRSVGPSLVRLDDVQWGGRALELAQMAARWGDVPALFVLTAAEESLDGGASRALNALAARAEVDEIRLEPLAAEHQRAVIDRLLRLTPGLSALVADRTRGNPMFAVQLVGDWVERGMLVSTEGGFELRDGVEATLPVAMREVWAERVAHVLAARPRSDTSALQAAAVLGVHVDEAEWSELLSRLRHPAPVGLVEYLVGRRIAVRTRGQGTWHFAHSALREVLVDMAEADGLGAELHLAVAGLLQGVRGPAAWARRGRHLLAGGDPASAIEPLLEAARALVLQDQWEEAAGLAREWSRAMEAAAVPSSSPRWGQGWKLRMRIEKSLGNPKVGLAWAVRLAEKGRQFGWPSLPWALGHIALAERWKGRVDEAAALYRESIALLEPLRREGTMLCNLASLVDDQDREEADRLIARAVEVANRSGRDSEIVAVHGRIALILVRRYDYVGAEAACRVVLELGGTRWGRVIRSEQYHILGECRREQGDLDAAAAWYAKVSWADTRIYPYAQCNLGLVHHSRGDLSSAALCFERALAAVLSQGRRRLVHHIHGLLLPIRAAEQDWEAFDASLAEAEKHSDPEPESERFVRQAAQLAELHGQSARAEAADALADAYLFLLEGDISLT